MRTPYSLKGVLLLAILKSATGGCASVPGPKVDAVDRAVYAGEIASLQSLFGQKPPPIVVARQTIPWQGDQRSFKSLTQERFVSVSRSGSQGDARYLPPAMARSLLDRGRFPATDVGAIPTARPVQSVAPAAIDKYRRQHKEAVVIQFGLPGYNADRTSAAVYCVIRAPETAWYGVLWLERSGDKWMVQRQGYAMLIH